MQHTVTLTYTIEALSWGEALEQTLRHPGEGITGCKVKTPGTQLLHVAPSSVRLAHRQIQEQERNE